MVPNFSKTASCRKNIAYWTRPALRSRFWRAIDAIECFCLFTIWSSMCTERGMTQGFLPIHHLSISYVYWQNEKVKLTSTLLAHVSFFRLPRTLFRQLERHYCCSNTSTVLGKSTFERFEVIDGMLVVCMVWYGHCNIVKLSCHMKVCDVLVTAWSALLYTVFILYGLSSSLCCACVKHLWSMHASKSISLTFVN